MEIPEWLKKLIPIYIIMIIVALFLVFGLPNLLGNDVHDYYKKGTIIEIDRDVVFGGTFTDWRHDLHFNDGTVLWLDHDSDLSLIRSNVSGMYHFKTNFFTYDGSRYEFYKLIDVRYYDDLEI